jgi:LDH2 family malate/lactate/ureidoglycolate dehydrogenase
MVSQTTHVIAPIAGRWALPATNPVVGDSPETDRTLAQFF